MKALVKSLNEKEKESLYELLTNSSEATQKVKAEREAALLPLKKALNDKVDALVKKGKELNKTETVTLDLRLTFKLESEVDVRTAVDNLKQGYQPDFDWNVTASVRRIDGKKGRQLAFIQNHLSNMVEDACEEIMEVFPEYKDKFFKLKDESQALGREIREFNRTNNTVL